jgi:hypothetical protein
VPNALGQKWERDEKIAMYHACITRVLGKEKKVCIVGAD